MHTLMSKNLVLPSQISVTEGEWARFEIYLEDQTPVFEGVGRCVQSVELDDDGSGYRFQVVLDSLQLEETSPGCLRGIDASARFGRRA